MSVAEEGCPDPSPTVPTPAQFGFHQRRQVVRFQRLTSPEYLVGYPLSPTKNVPKLLMSLALTPFRAGPFKEVVHLIVHLPALARAGTPMTIPHAYRRGAIYWYRCVLYLFQERKLVIRLSLRTAEPSQARKRSSVLTGATTDIQMMMESQFKHARHLGTSDLEAIGKQAFEQLLAGLHTAERKKPECVATGLRPTWSALHDLAQLLIASGGAPVELDSVEQYLRDQLGFDDSRWSNLCNVAKLAAGGDGILNEHRIDPLLRDHGFAVDEKNWEAARLAALPHAAAAYRIGAEGLAASSLLPAEIDRPDVKGSPPAAIIAHATVRVAAPAATAPMIQAQGPLPEPQLGSELGPGPAWSPLITITHAAELCIEKRVAHNVWGDDSTTQVRTAVAIFVFANKDLPVCEISQRHFGAMSSLFSKMATSWGRTKDELERGLAATMERAPTLPAAKIGLHVKTQRKHLTWVHAVLEYAAAHGIRAAEQITTKALTKARDSTPEHEKRMAWDGEELFRLLACGIIHKFAELLRATAGDRDLSCPIDGILARGQLQHREPTSDLAA